MPIVKETGSAFTPAPAGTHLARCVGMISLGTQQPNSPQYSPKFKIMLVFELPNERTASDPSKAMTVGKEYGAFLSEKSHLRKVLESWRGRPFTPEELKGFDVAQVIDKPCMITIMHKPSSKGGVYADVAAITSLPKGTNMPPRLNPLVHFEIEHGRNAVYEALPEYIRNKINACDEWMQPAPAPEPEHCEDNHESEEPPPF